MDSECFHFSDGFGMSKKISRKSTWSWTWNEFLFAEWRNKFKASGRWYSWNLCSPNYFHLNGGVLQLFYVLFLFTVLNVAAGKAPMQISTEGAGIPQKAIDGSTSSFFSAETCSLTKSERVPWWYVNLLEPYMVQLVRLDFGKSCCGKWNRMWCWFGWSISM